MKPLEVDVIVAEVGDDRFVGQERNSIFRVKFDGFISNHEGYVVIGGNEDDVTGVLKDDYRDGMPAGDAVKLGRKALDRGSDNGTSLDASNLEVCTLERDRTRRKFRRLTTEEVQGMLDA